MNTTDKDKNRNALLRENERLHQRIKALEERVRSMETAREHQDDDRMFRPPRRPMKANIEFIADFDVIEARGIDLSEGGVSFEVDEDLPFEMQFELNGRYYKNRAHLVWMKRLTSGGYRFGLMFSKHPGSTPTF